MFYCNTAILKNSQLFIHKLNHFFFSWVDFLSEMSWELQEHNCKVFRVLFNGNFNAIEDDTHKIILEQ